jgi:hypothetical protein
MFLHFDICSFYSMWLQAASTRDCISIHETHSVTFATLFRTTQAELKLLEGDSSSSSSSSTTSSNEHHATSGITISTTAIGTTAATASAATADTYSGILYNSSTSCDVTACRYCQWRGSCTELQLLMTEEATLLDGLPLVQQQVDCAISVMWQ